MLRSTDTAAPHAYAPIVSSFSGWACFDLLPGYSAEGLVARLRGLRELADSTDTAVAMIQGDRIFVYAEFSPQLIMAMPRLVAGVARRAVAAADWDDDGVENVVFGPDGTAVHRASIGLEDEIERDDTQESRWRAAELFGVDPSRLGEVSAAWAARGPQAGTLGEPYLRWWDALGVSWPDDMAALVVYGLGDDES